MAERMIQVPESLIKDAVHLLKTANITGRLPDAFDALLSQQNAEPVSIADMAPGTTFTAYIEDGVQRNKFERVESIGGGFIVYEPATGHYWNPLALDPSTVRDVQPPATPEETR